VNEKHNLLTHYLITVFGAAWGLTFEQKATLVLVLISAGTFFVNWYYKSKVFHATHKPESQNDER